MELTGSNPTQGVPNPAAHLQVHLVSRLVEILRLDGYRRGSTGSLSRARTPKTHSWTRRSGSWRTNRSKASIPRANSRRANERFVETKRLRSRSKFSGSKYSGP